MNFKIKNVSKNNAKFRNLDNAISRRRSSAVKCRKGVSTKRCQSQQIQWGRSQMEVNKNNENAQKMMRKVKFEKRRRKAENWEIGMKKHHRK